MTTRVLVIEDEPDLVDILRTWVDGSPGLELVGTSVGGRGCLELAAQLDPDVIILDLMVPNPGGPKLIPLLRRACDAKIIIWSAFELLRDRLEPTVDGWFNKTCFRDLVLHLEQLPVRA